MNYEKIQFGIDVFLQLSTAYKNIRFGLVTNNAATTSFGESSRKALLNAGFNIKKLFSPEHGLTAQGEDGAFQKNIIDPKTNLPVISLYGDNLMPDENDLKDVNAVLLDIPDVGCRFYTYLWTMTYVMEACAKFNKPLYILDRPNPTSGNISLSEGPMLDEQNCASFIGRWNIPVRHSCTLGELANYFSATKIKNIDLKIIKVQNWNREEVVKEISWFFVPPSPAITDVETALLYPGTGLLEGINVNEGRGTATPFKIFGAPWIKATELQHEFLSLSIPGINSLPVAFKPLSGLYMNEQCEGLQISVSDTTLFRPVNTGLQLIALLLSLYPGYCTERLYKTNVNPTGKNHLDKLTGVYQSLEKMKNGQVPETTLSHPGWKEIIQPHLLY
jgi:uncharacterized protein YbbC (DUF1343 family)